MSKAHRKSKLVFDETKRREFVGGVKKRKDERRRQAQDAKTTREKQQRREDKKAAVREIHQRYHDMQAHRKAYSEFLNQRSKEKKANADMRQSNDDFEGISEGQNLNCHLESGAALRQPIEIESADVVDKDGLEESRQSRPTSEVDSEGELSGGIEDAEGSSDDSEGDDNDDDEVNAVMEIPSESTITMATDFYGGDIANTVVITTAEQLPESSRQLALMVAAPREEHVKDVSWVKDSKHKSGAPLVDKKQLGTHIEKRRIGKSRARSGKVAQRKSGAKKGQSKRGSSKGQKGDSARTKERGARGGGKPARNKNRR